MEIRWRVRPNKNVFSEFVLNECMAVVGMCFKIMIRYLFVVTVTSEIIDQQESRNEHENICKRVAKK